MEEPGVSVASARVSCGKFTLKPGSAQWGAHGVVVVCAVGVRAETGAAPKSGAWCWEPDAPPFARSELSDTLSPGCPAGDTLCS